MELEMQIFVYDITCPQCESRHFSGDNQDDIGIPGEIGVTAACLQCGHEEEMYFSVTCKKVKD